jgi:hypothetical protein
MQSQKLLPWRIRLGKQFLWFILPLTPTGCAQLGALCITIAIAISANNRGGGATPPRR